MERRRPIKGYGVINNSASVLSSSSSGGAFMLLASPFVRAGGVVFGCTLDYAGTARLIMVEAEEDLSLLQGSKYVFSESRDAIGRAVDCLKQGRHVLFSGLPCQIAALKGRVRSLGLLSIASEKLLTVDLICHGTPSSDLFMAYRKWLDSKLKADEGGGEWKFRDKELGVQGWYSYRYKKNGREQFHFGSFSSDPYLYWFLKGKTYRNCCYKCRFACIERVSDFTLGDFWGAERIGLDLDIGAGISAVLLNTEKSIQYFDRFVKPSASFREVNIDDIVANQENLRQPSTRSAADDLLMEEVEDAIEAGNIKLVFENLLHVERNLKSTVLDMIPNRLLKKMLMLKMSRNISRISTDGGRDEGFGAACNL